MRAIEDTQGQSDASISIAGSSNSSRASSSELEDPDWDLQARQTKARVLACLRQQKSRNARGLGPLELQQEYAAKRATIDAIWERYQSGQLTGMQTVRDLDWAEEPDSIDFEPESSETRAYVATELQPLLDRIKQSFSAAAHAARQGSQDP